MRDAAAFGVDVGGSSIKHAVVEHGGAQLRGELDSVPTPRPSTPEALVAAITSLSAAVPADLPMGVALPSVIRQGAIRTAANVDQRLIGYAIEPELARATGRVVTCLNDADAAGLAEMRHGAARGQQGVVMVLTFGTGIGSALFVDGRLVPNTELGHIQTGHGEAEHRASARVRTEEQLDWPAWSGRVSEYLQLLHALFWPELFVLGGGVSEQFAHFGPLLRSPVPVRAAHFGAAAGVIGAALAARERHG